MNYIITGGTGFIGTHLTNLLNEVHPEAKVWNLDIVKPGTPNPVVKNYKPAVRYGETLGSTFVECDVRKPIENLPFVPTSDDVVFNCAAVHRIPGHEDIEYFETNIRGAENVCAFAEKHGINHIVFTSSIAPYGAAEELKEETTLPTPNTAYGISKLVAEKIHVAWQKGGEGRILTIVRPGVVFGKGENGNFSRLYWGIRKHTFAYPGRKDTIKACLIFYNQGNDISILDGSWVTKECISQHNLCASIECSVERPNIRSDQVIILRWHKLNRSSILKSQVVDQLRVNFHNNTTIATFTRSAKSS